MVAACGLWPEVDLGIRGSRKHVSRGILSTQHRLNSGSAPVRGEGPEDGHRPLLSPRPLSPHLVLATSLLNILAHSHPSPLASDH